MLVVRAPCTALTSNRNPTLSESSFSQFSHLPSHFPMSLPAAAIRRPVSTIAATLGVVLLGSVSLGRMPVSLLPDVTLPVLTIRTLYPDAAATEVSRFVAEPVEEAIAATPRLVELRSVRRNGGGD